MTNEHNRLAKLISDADDLLTENIFGPGEKRKSGGVARGGKISQKSQSERTGQTTNGRRTGGAGNGGGAQLEPQAQTGTPNSDEDELAKDYLEMDDAPLQPQTPLGKLIAQEFEQPISEPKGGDDEADGGEEEGDPVKESGWKPRLIHPDEIKNRNQSKKEAVGGSNRKIVTSLKTRNGKLSGRIESDGTMRSKGYLTITSNSTGKSIEREFPSVSQARREWTKVERSSLQNEAYQGNDQTVTGKDGKPLDVDEDAYEVAQKTEPTDVQQMDEPFTVQTKEGPAEGKAGDYLAKGVDGEQWPIDQKIFDKTHEFVDPEIQTGLVAQVKEAAEPTDKRGGYYIDTYKGWHIFALPGYSTPYYYAQGHSSDNYQTTRRVRNFIDKKLAKMGQKKLGESGIPRKKFVRKEVENEGSQSGSYGRSPIDDQPFGPFKGPGSNSAAGATGGRASENFEDLDFFGVKPDINDGRVSGGGPRSMKRTSGSTEWGKTRKKGKMSSGNLRRSATKRARRAGKKQTQVWEAHQAGRGEIVQVRADLWAATNIIGETRHFMSRKIAVMFANTKRNDGTPPAGVGELRAEAVGGKWVSSTNHFKPEGDHEAKTMARGMVQVQEDGEDESPEFLGKDNLSPDEMKIIDNNWKKILKAAATLFKKHPHPVALRAIEKYLEKLGIHDSHSMKIGEILAKQLNRDTDPTTMIIPKVIPKIQQEPYMRGSGYTVGGSGGLGPTR